MTKSKDRETDGYHALVVISPMCFGGETKDQDRALWSEATSTAALADGVTSSPFAAEAAELAVKFSPVFFKESDPKARLRVLADFLMAHRLGSQRSRLKSSPDTPQAMQEMLEEITRTKMTQSFQTTLVATSFVLAEDCTIASVVSVGDSAFFAFAAEGNLLATSLSEPREQKGARKPLINNSCSGALHGGMRFGPGAELLCKVVGNASEHPDAARQLGISPASASNFLVCVPLDPREPRNGSTSKSLSDTHTTWLTSGDVLFVPRHLVEKSADQRYQDHCWIRYSRVIRVPFAEAPKKTEFDGKRSATEVLPDHFYTDEWTHFQDRFPRDAQFVLASDGFYGCFAEPQELWTWLNENSVRLNDKETQRVLLEKLHKRMHGKCGDDDISFVWVRCKHPKEQRVACMGSTNKSERDRHAR